MSLIDEIKIGSVAEAEEILKGRPQKLQVGQAHPLNPNLVWTDLGNGHYAWRSKRGKYYNGGKYNPKRDPAAKFLGDRNHKVKYPVGAGTNGIRPMVKKRKKKE